MILLAWRSMAVKAADDGTLSGNWKIHSIMMGNEADINCTFTQNGDNPGGTCTTTKQGDKKISGNTTREFPRTNRLQSYRSQNYSMVEVAGWADVYEPTGDTSHGICNRRLGYQCSFDGWE